MAKGMYEKNMKPIAKPSKKPSIAVSFVEGTKLSSIKKPKSLTPMPKKK